MFLARLSIAVLTATTPDLAVFIRTAVIFTAVNLLDRILDADL